MAAINLYWQLACQFSQEQTLNKQELKNNMDLVQTFTQQIFFLAFLTLSCCFPLHTWLEEMHMSIFKFRSTLCIVTF